MAAGTPAAMGYGARCIFSKFFIQLFIFRKSKQNKYKKIRRLGRLGGIRLSYKEGKKNHRISIRKMT
jgi:hypothetical protein